MPAETMQSRNEADGGLAVHVAAVCCAGEVRFITAATSFSSLAAALAEHVRKSTPDQLWPADARRVNRLLAKKEFESAVDLYFRSVGGRWDQERLVVNVVENLGAPVSWRTTSVL